MGIGVFRRAVEVLGWPASARVQLSLLACVLVGACQAADGPEADFDAGSMFGPKAPMDMDADLVEPMPHDGGLPDGGPGDAGSGDAGGETGTGGHDHSTHDHGTVKIPDNQIPVDGSVADGFEWDVPKGFPLPPVPVDNPMTPAKVELGRHLFYERRLSDNGTFSCGSCHKQSLAFADGLVTPVGSTGQVIPRNSPGLANVGYAVTLTWANPLMMTMERQANVPLFADSPVELGLKSVGDVEARLSEDPLYQQWFAMAFPDEIEPVSALNMKKALSAFQRTLISGDSPYDRFLAGDKEAISESAKRGEQLFNGHPFECFHCHNGFNFSDHTTWQGKFGSDVIYHNTGLYNVDGLGAYPAPNTGVHDVTLDPRDMGKFKAPSLRNIAVTAPYMHDGSIATLSEVLDHYAAGGRTIESGPRAGVGHDNPFKDPLITGFELSEQERADLIAFLESLTDEAFLTNPKFSDPWE